jgi:hypothetical protein
MESSSEEETWVCPSCGAKIAADVGQCSSCRVSRLHSTRQGSLSGGGTGRRPASANPALTPPEVALPCFIPEARFSVVVAGGGATSWTGGVIYATTAGAYFLSEKDGFDSADKAKSVATDPDGSQPRRLATLSVFVPKGTVKRLVHGPFVGNFLEMADLKIPIRLPSEGWLQLVGACKKLGLAIQT